MYLQGMQEPLGAAATRAFSSETDGTIARGADGLILPHGNGGLVNLMAGSKAAEEARSRCTHEVELTERQACDVELLTVGGFTPLDGFMNEDAYTSVVEKMRCVSVDMFLTGAALDVPACLAPAAGVASTIGKLKCKSLMAPFYQQQAPQACALPCPPSSPSPSRLPNGQLFGLPVVMDTSNDGLKPGAKVMLTYKGQQVAVMDVESRWQPNKVVEVHKCYGSTSLEHPAVQMVATERGRYYLGGKVTGFELPKR